MTINVSTPSAPSVVEATTIEQAVALGGILTIPAGTSWSYTPPLIIAANTTITVSGGGTATLIPSVQTPDPTNDSNSNAIEIFGDNCHLTGIISDCNDLAGHAFRFGGVNQTFTNCQAVDFVLKGFGLINNGSPPSGIKLTGCSATSTMGDAALALAAFQLDSGSQQTVDAELTNCSAGVLTGGSEHHALKMATADLITVTNLTFDDSLLRLVLAEGLDVVQLIGFDWSRGLSDWLQIAPDLTHLERNQNVRNLIVQGLFPKP